MTDYLCAACALPGEKTASVSGIGRCARCPRRTGRALVGVTLASDEPDAPVTAGAPVSPRAPAPPPPFPAAAAVQRPTERPRTSLPPPAPVRFGPRRGT